MDGKAAQPDSRSYARRRRSALRCAGRGGKVDALLITRPQDVSYLSGFAGEDSVLLVGTSWTVLVTDSRYAEQAQAECGGIEIALRTGPMAEAVATALAGRGVRTLAGQADHLTLAQHRSYSAALGRYKLVAAGDPVADLRTVKDAAEVQAIIRAVRTAERAFRELLAQGAKAFVGRRERDVAAELDYRMRLAGASGPSFETIVAAGAHGSLPHYRPGPWRIRQGQPVLIDWGAKVDGYCSDLTRVVFIGRIPPQIGRIYELVLAAQKAGLAAVRSGAICRAVDVAARRVIAAGGHGEQFGHGLGHGVGREIHEAPALSPRSDGRLKRGMVVTVEPGVYLPGVGGVRIEDDVLVEADRGTVLTRLPKQMQAMVLK